MSGEFGKTVKPFNPEVQKKCIGDTKPITCRPADLIEPQLEKIEKEMCSVEGAGRGCAFLCIVPTGCYRFLQVS